MRYSSGWKELATKRIGADANFFYYEAQTPGFSYYAIAQTTRVTQAPPVAVEQPPIAENKPVEEAKQPEPVAPVVKEEVTPVNNTLEKNTKIAVGITIGLIILAVIVAVFFMWQKKKKDKEDARIGGSISQNLTGESVIGEHRTGERHHKKP
jgi:hypothetical protein